MNNDTAVREMLQDLTLGQPEAPVDRMVGVKRRHIRRRSLQGATTVVTAAAAVIGVLLGVGVLTGSGTAKPKSLHQPATKSWQLPWPDRSLAQASPVKAQALADWAHQGPTPIRDVHWLFAGQLEIGVSWAVFEAATGPGGVHQLVAMSSRDKGKTWAISSGDAPPASMKQIGFVRPNGKWVLILTAPGTDLVGMSDLSSGTARILPVVPTTDGVVEDRLQQTAAPDALLVGSPDLTSTFVVRFPNGGYVLPKWQRALVSGARAVPGYRALNGDAGAAPSTDGATVTNHRHYIGPMLEVLRCAGQAPLTFSMTASGQTTSRRIDRCDGQDVTLHLGTLGPDGKYTYTVSGDPTAIYALAVYVQKAQ